MSILNYQFFKTKKIMFKVTVITKDSKSSEFILELDGIMSLMKLASIGTTITFIRLT